MKYVLRVPHESPAVNQYVCFHVFPREKGIGWTSGWVLGAFPRYAAHFDRKDLAQRTIDQWATSSQPLPATVIIEEYDGV
jgi:hypothetical protein